MPRARSKRPWWLFCHIKCAFTQSVLRPIAAMVMVAACGPPTAYAQGQGFARAGPIDTASSFPQFYQDKTGRALEQCLDAGETDPCGITASVPDPDQPIVFPTNFPSEFFYWRAAARIRGL